LRGLDDFAGPTEDWDLRAQKQNKINQLLYDTTLSLYLTIDYIEGYIETA